MSEERHFAAAHALGESLRRGAFAALTYVFAWLTVLLVL